MDHTESVSQYAGVYTRSWAIDARVSPTTDAPNCSLYATNPSRRHLCAARRPAVTDWPTRT